MSRESVFAVVNAVGRLIPHFPLAVCGRAALVYYGHPDHQPSHVSVVCPEHAAALLVGWARTTGLRPSAHFPRAFYVVAPHPGGAAIGCVRVLACRDFERLSRVRRGPSATPVLALPHMADRMAGRFCDALTAGGDEAAPRVSDLLWTLRRIVEVGGDEQRLTLDSAPDFCCAAFLDPFTRRCPETVSLLREAGLTLRSLPGPQLVAPARSSPEAGSPCMGRDGTEQADEAQLPGTVREPSPASTVRARAIIASPHGRSASAQL